MTIDLHKWTFADRESLMALCNAVNRAFLSDRLPYPYTEADAWVFGEGAAQAGDKDLEAAVPLAFSPQK